MTSKNLNNSIEVPELFDEFYISYFGVNKLLVSMWGKLYKKEIIDQANLQVSGYKMGEDLVFNMQLHPFLTKISFVEDVVYNYRWGGMTNSFNPTFLNDIKKQYLKKKEAIDAHEYEKAFPFINYELANCFYSHFLNQLLHEAISVEELEKNIMEEVNDKIYLNFEFVKGERCELIFTKKIDRIRDEIFQLYKATYKKQVVKKNISKILSFFQ